MALPNALTASIIESYDSLGMTIEDICAANDGMEPIVVKSVLLQFSEKYRNIVKLIEGNSAVATLPAAQENLVNADELKSYVNSYKMLVHEDDPYLREKVLRNLINVGTKVTDGLGENRPSKLLESLGGVGNVMMLNNILQKAKEAKKRVQNNLEKVIDVESMETV